VLWAAPALGAGPVPAAPAVWVTLNVATRAPSTTTVTVPRVDVTAAEQARQRLAECSPAPSGVIDEGDRLTALWRLTEPCRDLAQLEQLLRALAARCGAAYVPATEALVSVPGSKNTRISPVHDVACVTWELGRRYAVGALVLP